jgi:thioredoxin 1
METPAAQGVTGEDFEEKVLHSDLPVLVDFHRPSCLPCQQLAPTIDKLAQEVAEKKADRMHVFKCEDARLFERLKIPFVPQLILFVAGKDHWIDRNIRSMEGLKKVIAEILARS